MTIAEIFEKINTHMIEGIMYHDQLADYYAFLGLDGFKRLHEHHAKCEFCERRKVLRYYVSRYEMLPDEGEAENPHAIPESWRGYTRQNVDESTRRKACREGLSKWRAWEMGTMQLYTAMYTKLVNIGEIPASEKLRKMAEDAEDEYICATKIALKLDAAGYDPVALLEMSEKLHKKYK